MISMATAVGSTFQDTETFGSRTSKLTGRHIRLAAGFGNRTTVGPGFLTNPGDGLLITMGVGFSIAEAGAGGPDLCTSAIVQCGRRHLCSSSALGRTRDSASAPSDGSRWARMISFTPGTDAASTT